MLKKLLILLIIICFVNKSIYSIYLHTKSYKNNYCMTKKLDNEDEIHISYLITGDSDEEKVDAKLTSPTGQLIQEKLNENAGEFKLTIRESGNHELCFNVPKPGSSYVSFEFYSHSEKGHTLDMAKDRKFFLNFKIFFIFLKFFI